MQPPEKIEHLCDNCYVRFDYGELQPIKDFFQRVNAGGFVPSGECPKCGALCYPVDSDGSDIQSDEPVLLAPQALTLEDPFAHEHESEMDYVFNEEFESAWITVGPEGSAVSVNIHTGDTGVEVSLYIQGHEADDDALLGLVHASFGWVMELKDKIEGPAL